MIVLLLLVLIVGGAVVAAVGLLGIGPLAGERQERQVSWGLVALATGGALVLVVVVLLGAMVGLRGAGGPEDDDPEAVAPSASSPSSVPDAGASIVLAGPIDSPLLGPVVEVRGDRGAVGGLRSTTVLRVRVAGFPPFARARAMQCGDGACANVVEVQFDESGAASFEYLVLDDFARGRCRIDGPKCSLVVEHDDGDERAEIVTLFVDPLPAPGRLALLPSGELQPRQRVDVRYEGLTAGASIDLLVCALPATSGDQRCTTVARPAVGTDGRGGTSVQLPAHVGRDEVRCERSRCVLLAQSSSAFVRAEPVPLRFVSPPPVDYDGNRLLVGLAIAAVLLAVAAWFVLRTDWSAIGEEAAPEIDDAEYADLDALVAAMPPEEDLDGAMTI